jgi:phospholipid-transporting ATPase
LEVGNYIVLVQDEQVPADVLILSTSDVQNVCYIETALLDGETNLKIRTSLSETSSILIGKEYTEAAQKIYKLEGSSLKSEHPNNRLYTYEGSVKMRGNPRGIPCDNSNIILRGSALKNTKWVMGMIVFTGIETKLVMNSKQPPHKRSNVERRVNKYLGIVFTMLFLTALVSTIISIIATSVNEER